MRAHKIPMADLVALLERGAPLTVRQIRARLGLSRPTVHAKLAGLRKQRPDLVIDYDGGGVQLHTKGERTYVLPKGGRS